MITPDRVSIGMGAGSQPPLRRIEMTVRAARIANFDAMWTVDHFQGWFPEEMWNKDMAWIAGPDSTPHAYFDYQALVGHLASRVGRMQIGVGVTEPLRRHPVLLAQTAMTWAHIAKSPPILGIGAGERENTVPYGIEFDRPVSRLEEALQIIRRAFESRGPFDFSGKFFDLNKATLDLTAPPERTPQIWVAAHGPRMLNLTGRFGDGWYPTFPMSPERYGTALAQIRAAAKTVGRNGREIVPGMQAMVVLGRTEREAGKYLDSKVMRFMSLLVPATYWEQNGLEHPFGEKFRGLVDFIPTDYPVAQIEDALAKVPVEIIAENVLWGTPDMVRDELENYVDAGLRHIVLSPGSAAMSRRSAVFSVRAVFSILRQVRKSANARLGAQ